MWDVFDEEVNRVIMITGFIIIVLVSTWSNVEMCFASQLYLFLIEYLVYWPCHWGATGVCPYPILHYWFDSYFASFRVLGGIYQAIPFWPYVPFFYVPGYCAMAQFP